ncbi:RNA-guided endonuclease InsQ/TnpB family protein [Fusobacterium mortiferum]|uniref:IS200/IS605 family element transposase accessory protein TnpB n=1 Tax=Fusobacterium mortiferum TaxID=850 RepID=A0ABS2G007_FUSMR|nr:RNA-guided endonuclease TnpB family protein [Fusobacterium mortiferum]MBM6874550.1 IS200/IS605 family element transposase accessory protein TnpB [Fusobacterium mortiferum]
MYLTVKQQLKHLNKEEYLILRELCHTAKNLYNQAVYNIRQYYFDEGKYFNYVENNKLLKSSENYKTLNSNMAQQILKEVDGVFKSFFGLLKLKSKGEYKEKVKLPKYLPKNSFTTLVVGFVRLNENTFILPYSQSYKKNHKPIKINIPPLLLDKNIKEIRIIPKFNARFFEIQYTYQVENEQRNLDKNNALAIDLGVNNLATCVTNRGKSFIVDGKKLKSINQWFNKYNAKLQSIKDKQDYGKALTMKQKYIWNKRNNKVNDYLSKSARIIINYCLENNIGTLVCGYNNDFQRNSDIGKRNNQNFVNIPFSKLQSKLEYLCEFYGIKYVDQEESYTSKASFFDMDIIPEYKEKDNIEYSFSGKRVRRGMYKTLKGYILNADVNGALNILKKSKVVDLEVLYHRGEVDTPVRIRVS